MLNHICRGWCIKGLYATNHFVETQKELFINLICARFKSLKSSHKQQSFCQLHNLIVKKSLVGRSNNILNVLLRSVFMREDHNVTWYSLRCVPNGYSYISNCIMYKLVFDSHELCLGTKIRLITISCFTTYSMSFY